jgi:hypothetical protein
MNNQTTYTLLVRSEERSRDLLETAVYAMCTLSAIVAIWQFAQQPLSLAATKAISSQHVDPQVNTRSRA